MKTLFFSLIAVLSVSSANACPQAASLAAQELTKINNELYRGARIMVVPGPTSTTYKVVSSVTGPFDKRTLYTVDVRNRQFGYTFDILTLEDRDGSCEVVEVKKANLPQPY